MKKGFQLSIALTVLMLFSFVGTTTAAETPKRISDVKRITAEEVKQLKAQEEIVVVDTRAPGQWLRAKDKAPGAMRVQSYEDLTRFKEIVPPDRAIVTYCT